MVYSITRAYVKIALWFFYEELKVQGLKNIPKDQPVIFTPNHQNSFMDAVLIACIVPQPIYYLVRASVFKSKIVKWLLSQLNMMPIYRFRDGLREVKKNDIVMDACSNLLRTYKPLMIFPEGNHDMKYAIRPLQKGVARIAFQTIDKYQTDVKIIPVGIYYEDHTASRSRVLVNFGIPISTMEYYEEYQRDPNLGFKALICQISLAMQQLTIHIPPNDKYDYIYDRWRSIRNTESTIIDQYNADQENLQQIERGVERAELQNKTSCKKSSILLFPLYIYGLINHLMPYLILNRIITKRATDIHFYSSIKLTVSMILVPLFYGLQAYGLYSLGLEIQWIVLYVVTLPISGMAAYRYHLGETLST